MGQIINFSETFLKQVKWWNWLAAVLPLTALTIILLIWVFGSPELFSISVTVGATIMFVISVSWWWWIIQIVSTLLKKNQAVVKELESTSNEIKQIKNLVRETFVTPDK